MLRVFLLCTLSTILTLSASAQRKELRKFTNAHSSVAETHRLGLSMIPFRIVSWFIPGKAWDGTAREVKWALKKVRSVKLWTIEMDEDQTISDKSIAQLKETLYTKHKFEPLMELRSKGAHIYLLSNGKTDNHVGNLVALIQEDGEMVMVHLKTRLTMDDISRIANKINELDNPKPEIKDTIVAIGSGTIVSSLP